MRPSINCCDEIAFNQMDAFESWLPVFERIIYFNQPEEDYERDSVEFIEAEDFPTIREIAIEASQQDGWSCLINADIQVHPKLKVAMQVAESKGALCAMSSRWELPNNGDMCRAQVVDNGLDFFAATPDVWAGVAKQIPEAYRISHPVWDTWVLGYFMKNHGIRCADLTGSRVIYHPKHEDRRHPKPVNYNRNDPVLKAVRYPTLKIAV